MKTARTLIAITVAASLILIAFIGCESVTGPGPTDGDGFELPEIEGAIILKNGTEIIEIKGSSVRGQIFVEKGQNGDIYTIEFRDVNEEVVEMDDKTYDVCCNFLNMNCAGIERDEQLDKNEFYLYGYNKGETKFNLVLTRDNTQHYKTPNIALKVQ